MEPCGIIWFHQASKFSQDNQTYASPDIITLEMHSTSVDQILEMAEPPWCLGVEPVDFKVTAEADQSNSGASRTLESFFARSLPLAPIVKCWYVWRNGKHTWLVSSALFGMCVDSNPNHARPNIRQLQRTFHSFSLHAPLLYLFGSISKYELPYIVSCAGRRLPASFSPCFYSVIHSSW
jgi:hypothetical protein